MSSHAKIRPKGAEKEQRKVYVGLWVAFFIALAFPCDGASNQLRRISLAERVMVMAGVLAVVSGEYL